MNLSNVESVLDTVVEEYLSNTVIIIGTVSAVLSLLLTIVSIKVQSTYLSRYQHVLVFIGINGMLYSICEICTVPYWYISKGDFVLFAVGPVHQGLPGQILLLLFAISFMQALWLISYSFMFQYTQICKNNWFKSFPHYKLFGQLINILIILDWVIAVVYCFWPTPQKVEVASKYVKKKLGIVIEDRSMLGFSISIQNSDALFHFLIANIFVILLLFLFCIIFCANRIISKVSSDLSNRSQYSAIYRLLLIQCIAPTLFSIFPCSFNFVTGLAAIDLGDKIPFLLAVMLPMYPAVNSIILIFKVKDYRTFIFRCKCCGGKYRGKRKSVVTSM